jgi:Mu DNA binding, I gamma subdomain
LWKKLCFDFVAVTSQWQFASDEDWALALARAAVICPLIDQAELTEGLVATASAELGISRSLVYRLVAKFRKRPQISSLLPGKRGRKAAARVLSEATEAVVREAIASVYLQREKPRLSDLLKEIQRQCQRKGLSVPNFQTVKRRVDAIDAKEHVRKRSGAKAARDRFRPTRVMSTADLLPLERVQIDHTRIDVVVVNEGDRLPIGRPWYGIRIDYRPPGTPHFGGHIERLIGTTMGAVHILPGSTFSNVAEKGDYPSEKTSALTLVELERWLALQVGGVHHQTVHSSLLKPPAAAWQDGLARRRQAPRKPADPQTFFLDFLPEEWRLIRRDGIQMFNILRLAERYVQTLSLFKLYPATPSLRPDRLWGTTVRPCIAPTPNAPS